MPGIQDDLKDGGRFEDFILAKVQKQFPLAKKMEGYFPDYDIEVPETENTLECKFDRMSSQTGNLAIEFEYNKKPSGINRSLAKQWVIGYWRKPEQCWGYAVVEAEALKKACEGKRTVNGGDRWASRMYLLPVADLEKIPGIALYLEEEDMSESPSGKALVS